MIYFIEAVGSGAVKIGYTDAEPAERLRQLQTGCPLELRLLASSPGTENDEADLHQQFQHLRIRGEWFKIDDELRSVINVMRWVLPQVQGLADAMRKKLAHHDKCFKSWEEWCCNVVNDITILRTEVTALSQPFDFINASPANGERVDQDPAEPA